MKTWITPEKNAKLLDLQGFQGLETLEKNAPRTNHEEAKEVKAKQPMKMQGKQVACSKVDIYPSDCALVNLYYAACPAGSYFTEHIMMADEVAVSPMQL